MINKKLTFLFILLITIFLCSCSFENNNSNAKVNTPLVVHISSKDNAEYFAVKKDTDINNIDFKDFLNIDVNKEVDYEIKWVGDSLAYRVDNYNDLIGLKVSYNNDETDETENTIIDENLIQESKFYTLSREGIKGVSIYILVKDGDLNKCYKYDTLLLVYPQELEDVITSNTDKTVESVLRLIYQHDGEHDSGEWWVSDRIGDDFYFSNIY